MPLMRCVSNTAKTKYIILKRLRVLSANIAIDDTAVKSTFFGQHFCRRKYRCIFNHFYAKRPESYRIRGGLRQALRPLTHFDPVLNPDVTKHRYVSLKFLYRLMRKKHCDTCS